MDVATVIGIVFGFAMIAFSIATGGAPKFFLDPKSVLIVWGGTAAAILINFPLGKVLGVIKIAKRAFMHKMPENVEVIATLVRLSAKARMEGLLALESDLEKIQDEFLKKGVRQLVDGVDPELVRSLLTTELVSLEERHALGQRIFNAGASYAPAFGMLGTLIGLISMLSRLNDPTKIGVGMAVALVTTFWGVVLANLVFLPIAGKLKTRSEQEVQQRELIIEGIASIQAGDNPRILNEKLLAFLSPQLRASANTLEKAGLGAKQKAAA